MTEGRTYAPGTFIWADLVARDVGVAKGFYMPLFGWTLEEVPVMDGAVYNIFSRDGQQVCAMFEMFPGMLEGGHPPHWQSYVSVESADASAERATAAGGRVVKEPCDVMEVGRMAMIQDPTGAFLSLWQPRAHTGAQAMNRPGAIAWNELLTRDTGSAASFYAALFGWTSSVVPGAAGGDYVIFHNDDQPCAGMIEIRPDMGDIPPCWEVYFGVADLDVALEEAKRLGGQGTFAPLEIAEKARIAGLMDPQGAAFTIMEQRNPPA